MSELIEKAKASLKKQKTSLEGRLVEKKKDSIILAIGGYLVEIPLSEILDQKDAEENTIIVSLKPDAEVLMTAVANVEELVGVISGRISKGRFGTGYISDCTECSYCTDCTECSYCTDCTECSYCTDYTVSLPFTMPMRERIRRFKGTRAR